MPKPPEVCPWCAMIAVPMRIGPLEVCPLCRQPIACSEEGSERFGQLPARPRWLVAPEPLEALLLLSRW